jgi:glycosyltransferase involved in cell wall biosynthesis
MPTEPGTPLRLLVLCAGDPNVPRTFSGSARNLIAALQARGVVHHAENVLGWTDSFRPSRGFHAFLRAIDRFRLEDAYNWSALAERQNTRRAHAVGAAHPGYNACLMYGTSFHPLLGVPTYCYFDATAAQVGEAHAWDFGHFSSRKIAGIVRRQQAIFEMCRGIFPRTRWAATSVHEDFGVPWEKICVAGAGPNDLPAPLPHGPYDRKNILFVGAEFERKGGPLILAAFQRLRQAIPDATLTIVGCTPSLDVPGVEVVGHVSKHTPEGLRRMQEYYARASVFCIMSSFEPFGIVILEASISGVPCVAPRRFAFSETVRDGETGRLVETYGVEELSRVLGEMLASPEKLEAMGRAAQAFVAAEWTWDVAAERIIRRIRHDMAARTA